MSLEREDGSRKLQFRTYILPWKKRLSLLHLDVMKEDGHRLRGVGGKALNEGLRLRFGSRGR